MGRAKKAATMRTLNAQRVFEDFETGRFILLTEKATLTDPGVPREQPMWR
jgi:hypothetical protein